MLVSVPAPRRSSLLVGVVACLCVAPAAYASGFPQQASDTASAVLTRLGVTPGSHADGGAPAGHGQGAAVSALAKSAELAGAAKGAAVSALASGGKSQAGATGHAGASSDAAAAGAQGKGAQVSTLAKTTTATGVDKGAAISTLASGGKSLAGQQGSSSAPTGTSQTGGTAAPVLATRAANNRLPPRQARRDETPVGLRVRILTEAWPAL
jgi:hypothetical protein